MLDSLVSVPPHPGILYNAKQCVATLGPFNLIVNIALSFPDGPSWSTTNTQAQNQKNALLDTSNGVNDATFANCAAAIRDAGFPNAIIRLGYEFDGNWMLWSCAGNFTEYIAAFRHAHDVMKAQCPTLLFDYNGTFPYFSTAANAYAGDTRTKAEAAYPGSAYVDVIGVDIYDRGLNVPWYDFSKQAWNDPNRAWNDFFLPFLSFHRAFAMSKGKPISFPEWAVQAHAEVGGLYFYSGGDDPVFVKNMYNWMESLPATGPGSLKYDTYFNYPGTITTDPTSSSFKTNEGPTDLTSPQLVNSASMFMQLFGAKWGTTDVGNVNIKGSSPLLDQLMSGQFVMNGSGAGVTASADGFQFAYQTLSGDGEIVAQVTSMRKGQGITPQAMAGVMMREDFTAGSKFALMALNAQGQMAFVSRATTDTPSKVLNGAEAAGDYWVKLVRNADNFLAYKSVDGVIWTLAGSASIPIAGTVKIGLVVSSGNEGWTTTSTFQNVRIDRWTPSDVYPYDANFNSTYNYGYTSGSVGLSSNGTLAPATGALTVSGSGAGIGGVADSFDFNHQTLVGNGQIVARMTAVQQNNANSQAGVMIRESLAAGSKSVLTSFAPGSGYRLTSRTADNAASVVSAGGGATGPYWVKLVRSGSRFNGYQSADGVLWTRIASADVDMGLAVEIGLSVTSADKTLSNVSTFDHIRVDRWSSADIGTVGLTGSEDFDPSTGTYRVAGSGSGMTGTADSFHFVYQALTGDCEIMTRVQTQNLNQLSKAGLMMREALSAGSTNVMMSYAPGWGFALSSRLAQNSNTEIWPSAWALAPYWLKLIRRGNLFIGYKSPDGVVWTFVGQYNVPMAQTIYVGLASSSCDPTKINTSVFDSIRTNTLASSDVGTVTTAGSESFDPSSGVFSIKSGGTGIGGTADSYRYLCRPLTGDGQIVARVRGGSQFNPQTSEGVMIRESLAPGAKTAMMSFAYGGGFNFKFRSIDNATMSTWPGSWSDGPYWVKLIRIGNTFAGYKSPDGVAWTQVGTASIPMGANVYIGLAATAADATRLNNATIDLVSITLAPYYPTYVFY